MISRAISIKRSTIKKVLIAMVIILLFAIVVSAEDIKLFMIEMQIQNHYNNWNKPEYQDWCCRDTSVECEKYFETHGYNCYLVYGDRHTEQGEWLAHMWNIVMIDDKPYEFESTALFFKKVSEKYNVLDIQEGFYVNGIEYNKSQPLDNWENLI